MNTTSNYGLSQWEASDRILREDFNNDNQLIDTALADCGKFVKLKEITTTAAAAQVDVAFSDIDWSAWQEVCIHVAITVSGMDYNTSFNFNSHGQSNYLTGSSTTSGSLGTLCTFSSKSFSLIRVQSWKTPSSTVFCQSLSGRNACFGCNTYLTLSQITTLNLINSQTIAAGSKITVWGVR